MYFAALLVIHFTCGVFRFPSGDSFHLVISFGSVFGRTVAFLSELLATTNLRVDETSPAVLTVAKLTPPAAGVTALACRRTPGMAGWL